MPSLFPQSIRRILAKLTAALLATAALLPGAITPSSQAQTVKPRLDLFGDPLPKEASARMGSSRLRHPRSGRAALAFSADGRSLISGAGNGIRIWDAATGESRRRFDVSSDWTHSFALTEAGILAAGADYEKGIVTLQVFDPVSGKVRRRLQLPDRATSANVTLSRDGKWLAYGHQNDLRLHDAASGREVLRLPWGRDIAFAPDGKTVVICDFSDSIRIHDTAKDECLHRLKHEADKVAHIAISLDGRYLASIPWNDKQQPGEIGIWDLQTGKERHRLKGARNYVLCAAFSPDDRFVAVGCQHRHLLLFDMETGKEVRRYPTDAFFGSIAFSPDGKSLAAVSGEGVIRMWETATGRVLPASADPMLDSVRTLQFRADGRRLLGHAGVHFAWDAKTGRELRRFPKVSEESYWPAALAPDESLLVTTERDGTIRLWDAKTGRKTRELKGHEKWISSVIFSSDSRRLASSGGDGTIRIWDAASGRELYKLTGGGNSTNQLVFSPDRQWLASAGNSRGYEVILWDLTSGREKARFNMAQSNSAHQLAFSPDSRLVAAVGGGGRLNDPGEVQVWNLTGDRQRRWFSGHKDRVGSVAFSPDNRTMATGT